MSHDDSVVFPLTVTLSSSNFHLEPTGSNTSSGWVPSCSTSACASTATWSTSAPNSTMAYTWWGSDAEIHGSVQGDLDVEVILDGNRVTWNPSNDKLFGAYSLDQLKQHSLSIKLINASPNALLSINEARINGSALGDNMSYFDWWLLNSNDREIMYSGFSQQPVTGPLGSMSPFNHFSSSAGDLMALNFNASAVAVFGPCGPSSGLVRVTLDGEVTTVNTTKPIQADDCMLFQSKGIENDKLHKLTIVNEDGRELTLNRMEFIRTLLAKPRPTGKTHSGAVVGLVFAVTVVVAIAVISYSMRSKETRQRINRLFKTFRN